MIELLRIPLVNRPGQLHDVVTTISNAGINMKALSVMHHGADASEVLLLVNHLGKAQNALTAAGRDSTVQPAIAVEVSDDTGGLASVLDTIQAADLSINDLFTFVTRVEGKALAVATFDSAERAEAALQAGGHRTVDQRTIDEEGSAPGTGPHLLDDYLGGSFFW